MDTILVVVGILFGCIAGMMISFYIALCLVSWVQDIFNKTTWRWKK